MHLHLQGLRDQLASVLVNAFMPSIVEKEVVFFLKNGDICMKQVGRDKNLFLEEKSIHMLVKNANFRLIKGW